LKRGTLRLGGYSLGELEESASSSARAFRIPDVFLMVKNDQKFLYLLMDLLPELGQVRG